MNHIINKKTGNVEAWSNAGELIETYFPGSPFYEVARGYCE